MKVWVPCPVCSDDRSSNTCGNCMYGHYLVEMSEEEAINRGLMTDEREDDTRKDYEAALKLVEADERRARERKKRRKENE